MFSRRIIGFCLTLLALPVLSSVVAPGVSAQEWSPPNTVWVEQSGHTVDGLFLNEWRTYPDLLGQPITEELNQNIAISGQKTSSHTVQFFENLAVAYLPDETRSDWQVQALPLGRDALKADAKFLKNLNLPGTGSCMGLDSDNCISFAKTKHTVRLGFEDYWSTHDGERLFGIALTEEFVGKNGVTTQYFEHAVLLWTEQDDVTVRPIGTETAKRLKLRTTGIAQPLDVPVYDEELFVPPVEEVEGVGGYDLGEGPGPQQGAYKEIVVSISAQSMWAYEDGDLVVSSLVSTGIGAVPETVTPLGYYSILVKFDSETMEGTISDEHYRVEDVPYVMYFDNLGNALHGTYWHNNFGTPMSHGCVNLPLDVAAFLYGWAPEGTAVTVIE